MKNWHGLMVAAVACAFGLTQACSSTNNGGGGNSTTACDDYFEAAIAGNCSGVLPPASEIARVKARFETLCADTIALSGSGLTASSLETCVAAIHSSGCSVVNDSTGACSFQGTLAAGASCASSGQCASGSCSAGASTADGGISACGTCMSLPAVGQPCSNDSRCVSSASCMSSSTGGTGTCVAFAHAGAGASCEGSTPTQCNAGLVCNSSGICAVPAPAGLACMDDSDCASPLICPPTSTGSSSMCAAAGGAGAACLADNDCAQGLGCNETSMQCATVMWASSGQPCGSTIRCLVGFCNTAGGGTMGTCPTVIPEGQACDESSQTSTCDSLANCVGGICTLGYATCH